MKMSKSPAKDFPALSLSLGIFRDDATAAEAGGIGGRGQREEETVEISSENSGPVKSRSEEDYDLGEEEHEEDEDEIDGNKKKKRKYHRHSPEQIKEMEALFKECPHPDEKQRLELSKKLGLHPRQVKFWFQNRRTQLKAVHERHENSLLKAEIDKLQEELRDALKKKYCPNCGSTKDNITSEENKLRIENSRLKAEVERLRSITGKAPHGTSPYPAGKDQEARSSLDFYKGSSGLEKSHIMDAAYRALEELRKMASQGEPLWIRSNETGREILNYDEYRKEFCDESYMSLQPGKYVEASRESGVVFGDLPGLILAFMDSHQWEELFPCLMSKASTVDVICNGGANRDGVIQLMFAEIQMLTPLVATREVYFIRYSKRLGANQWAYVDVSLDGLKDSIDASMLKCRKRPSGCIIEDKSNGHCKVTWVEHLECQRTTVHALYRTIVNSGLAFGAKHWIATLQQQCERLVFVMATNVPVKDSSGVTTLAGRKSILKLAQRMAKSFCRAIGDSSLNSWTKVTGKSRDDIRVAIRKNLNDPGEPLGTIMSAATSVWLPVSHQVLFDFLRDENRRMEWEIMSNASQIKCVANLAKGQDRGNVVTALALQSNEHKMWLLQDCSSNAYESTVIYAPLNVNAMQGVITGCDSGNVALLPSGFSILSDGIETRPLVITRRPEEKIAEGGSLLTVAFQIQISNSSTAKLYTESHVDSIKNIISRTLQNIRNSLHCED